MDQAICLGRGCRQRRLDGRPGECLYFRRVSLDEGFVNKYDAAGNLEWARQLEPTGPVTSLLTAWKMCSSRGHFFASLMRQETFCGRVKQQQTTGTAFRQTDWEMYTYQGSVSSGSGSGDVYVSKYDEAGILQWTTLLETDRPDSGSGVSADGLGKRLYFRFDLRQRGWSRPIRRRLGPVCRQVQRLSRLHAYADPADCCRRGVGRRNTAGFFSYPSIHHVVRGLPVTWSNLVPSRPTEHPRCYRRPEC